MKEQINPYNTKSWSKMSAVNKRKSIAWDVLYQMKLGKVRADYGYCGLDVSNPKDTKQAIINQKVCESCAMGSMMTVDILNRNNFKGDFLDSKKIIKRFEGIFSEFQLRLIETAYEKRVIANEDNLFHIKYQLFEESSDLAENFGYKYVSNNTRLTGIMKNILKDEKGLFLGIDHKS